jgi:hypothetical protein
LHAGGAIYVDSTRRGIVQPVNVVRVGSNPGNRVPVDPMRPRLCQVSDWIQFYLK